MFVHQYKLYKYRSGDKSARPIINLETVYYPNQKQKFVITKYLDTWYDGKFRYGKNHFVQNISDLKGKTLRFETLIINNIDDKLFKFFS